METGPITIQVELTEHFGHCSLTLRHGPDWIRVNCAAETANRDLLAWLSEQTGKEPDAENGLV